MKKTLRWSVLLTLLLVCVTIPVMAQRAEAADYDVWVGDTQVTDENKTDVLGDGTVSYDAGTLTLKDAAITDAHGFTNDSGVNCTANIYAEGALTVTGSGTLSGADYGVYVKPDVTGYEKLTFEDAKLDVRSSEAAASTEMGDITVTGASDVTAAGGTYGFEIRIKGIFEVKSGTVTATGSTLAIYATVDVDSYTDCAVFVNTAASASGASEWNKADILGRGGSFKYVRIMPKSDFAEYDLWVGGVQATSLNRDDILGDNTGSAKFDPTTNTLTLNNPKIAGTHEDAQIHSKGIGLTIQGDAELTLPGALMGILTEDGDLTITGGTLTAEGSKWGIRAFTSGVVGFSKITVSGGTVRAKGGDSSSYDYSGIASDAYIYISDGTVFVEGRHGMTAEYLIEISGGQVTAEGSSEGVGIYAYGGDLRITGGHVSAVSNGTKETIAAKYDLEISGEDTVVESLNKQGAAALRSNFGTISIADTLVILEPNDGAVGEKNGKKVVLKSDGTTAADHVIIKKGEYYDLWVGGVQANSENEGNILGDTGEPSAVFNSGTNTLTLTNLTYSGKGYEYNENGSQAAVCYLGTETLNLVISGTNSVTQTGVSGETAFSLGFFSEGPVTVSGTGVLNVSGGTCKSRTTYGMQIKNDLTVESGTINAFGASTNTGSVSSVGLGAYTLIMNGGTVQGTGGNVQITMTGVEVGTLNMNGGTLTGIGGNKVGVEESPSIGIRVSSAEIHGGTVVGTSRTSSWSVGIRFEGKMNMDGGKVTATGGTATKTGSFGVMFSGGSYHEPSFIISGTAEITATGGAAKTRSSGIYGYQDFVIAGGKITAKGGEAEEVSSGLMTSDYHNGVDIIIKGGEVTATAAGVESCGINAGKDITISGGKVTANGGFYGIFAGNDIIITGCEVTAKGETAGIYSKKDLAISGTSTVNVDAATFCFYSEGSMNIRDSVVTASGTWETSLYCGFQAEGNMEITDSKVNATGHFLGMRIMGESLEISGANTVVTADGTNTAIEAKNGKIEIYGGAEVNATGGLSCGICAQKDITISGGSTVVTAEGKKAAIEAVSDKIEITGGAQVTATATGEEGYAIHAEKNITISGSDTVVTADGIVYGIDSANGTLSIKDAKVTAAATNEVPGNIRAAIYAKNDITISGATVTATANGKHGNPIYAHTGEITITEATVTTTATGLYGSGINALNGNITISGGNTVVTVEGGADVIDATKGTLSIDNAKVTATATGIEGDAIRAHEIKISGNADVTSTASADTGDAISATYITISGSTVTATATGTSGRAFNTWKDITISGSTVTATATNKYGKGIYTYNNITISGGTVTATATGENSYGIYASNDITITDGNTVVTADGKVSAIYAKDGTISIASPLGIFEPAGGILDDAKQNICTFDGKVSPHAVIKQFDPTAPGMTHTVKWINDDGTVLETDTDVPYGSLPTYDGATPTKAAAGGKTYTFKGWTPDVVPVTADATYTATYDESSEGGSGTGTTYTVTWRNYDGTILETDTNVPYGSLPTYDGMTPYRPSTSVYNYSFSGWKPSVVPVTENTTYTADFTATPILGPGGSSFPFYPVVPGGVFPGIPGTLPGGTPGSTPGGTPGTDPGSTPGTDPGSTPGTDPGSTPGGETGLPFTDVTPDSPYLEDIQYVYENDLMNGMSETEFGENLPLTRGMIVTVLHRMEGRPEAAYTGVFTDVPAGEWYTDGVEWAASHGIVLGYGNGKYGPNDNVTREQLAAILFRYANWKGYDTSVGEDTNILSYDDAFTWGDWAVSALQWACGAGVLEDVPAGMLRPTEAATRGEIAHAIRIFCEEVAK